jgi:IS5 family transposase
LVRGGLTQEVPEAVREFPNRTRRARRRMQEIARRRDRKGKRQRARRRTYTDLLAVSEPVVAPARTAATAARATPVADPLKHIVIQALCEQIQQYAGLTERGIDQTRRRAFGGQTVAADHKLYSLFEPHTDPLKRRQGP